MNNNLYKMDSFCHCSNELKASNNNVEPKSICESICKEFSTVSDAEKASDRHFPSSIFKLENFRYILSGIKENSRCLFGMASGCNQSR